MSSIDDNTRSLARGVHESIAFMSGGRSPQPRSKVWFWMAVASYGGLLGLLGTALYIGVQAGA